MCFLTTDSYRNAVLKSVTLGEDTDMAAVTGAVAGLFYGLDDIPTRWFDTLAGWGDSPPFQSYGQGPCPMNMKTLYMWSSGKSCLFSAISHSYSLAKSASHGLRSACSLSASGPVRTLVRHIPRPSMIEKGRQSVPTRLPDILYPAA